MMALCHTCVAERVKKEMCTCSFLVDWLSPHSREPWQPHLTAQSIHIHTPLHKCTKYMILPREVEVTRGNLFTL